MTKKTPPKRNKVHRINIPVTLLEQNRIRIAAEKAGMPTATFARAATFEKIEAGERSEGGK